MLRLHRSTQVARSQRQRPQRRSARTGFSLIELLVSIAIFVILATIALSAFRDSKHDKIASGSRQISASINGAKSRAGKAVEQRGIRFLRDKQDYRLISGLQYIGQSQLFDGTVRVQIDNQGVVWLTCQQPGDWRQLFYEGLLKPGAKIRVPANETGRWYTISSAGPPPVGAPSFATLVQGEDANSNDILDLGLGEDLDGDGFLDRSRVQLVGAIDGAVWNPFANPTGTPPGAFQYGPTPYPLADPSAPNRSNTTVIPYLLRLSPQELPDAEPVNLPPGVVIDLPSSRYPTAWNAFEDRDQNGVLDAGEDLNGNGVLDDVTFDIPVSPNGTVPGAISGSGPIYFYLCTREDVDRTRSMLGTSSGGVYGSDYGSASDHFIPGDFENGYGPDHPSSERKIVCIIPQTGLVYLADVNGTDADAPGTPGYGWADDPFSYARAGREGR